MQEEGGANSSLAAIFAIALFSLFLIPFTIYRCCNSSEEEDVVKPWESGKGKKSLYYRLKSVATTGNLITLLLWVLWTALMVYIQVTAKDSAPFDPFAILQVPPTATTSEIRRSYRQLSLLYHPDKNPDPKATAYFRDYIAKAYAALTDEVARKNYEKYGHPDGQVRTDLGIALPDWLLKVSPKSAPLVLGGLVGGGILLPLAVISWYLLRSNKYTGPNNVMHETMELFLRSKFAIKELQSLVRIPDTLSVAMEFIVMPTPSEHTAAMDELRRTVLRLHPDLKEKKPFWQRKTSVVKAHMLLLAHIAREDIPQILEADLKYVLKKSPVLLEEMAKIATLPRTQAGNGWLAPLIGCIEMTQCLVQALSITARKGASGKAGSDVIASLLALPHMDADILKKLSKKRVRSQGELSAMSEDERTDALVTAGLTLAQAADVSMALMAIPTVHISAECMVEGEEDGDIIEQDIVTCSIRVKLTRASHSTAAFKAEKLRGSGVQAFAPHYPFPKTEKWYFVLADVAQNAVLAWAPANLLQAEIAGARAAAAKLGAAARLGSSEALPALTNGASASNGSIVPAAAPVVAEDPEDDPNLQLVELKFPAPRQGKYNLTLHCLSDSWVGVDTKTDLQLKVLELTRAAREGRTSRGKSAIADFTSEIGSGSEDGEEEEEEEEDYDSEEDGSDESGDEADGLISSEPTDKSKDN